MKSLEIIRTRLNEQEKNGGGPVILSRKEAERIAEDLGAGEALMADLANGTKRADAVMGYITSTRSKE